MSEAPRNEPRPEPEWVPRMRAAGYNVRVGTGEGTLNEIPDAMFDPPTPRVTEPFDAGVRVAEAPRNESRPEPEWVQRMRAAGYNVRVGRGEPMSEIPEAFFYPPPTLRSRVQERIVSACKRLVHALTSSRRTTHAPLP